MRILSTAIAALLLALPSAAETVVFRNVNVISMTSPKVAEKQTVVVSEGKIGSILKEGAMVKLPEGTIIIDGTGKYLMPGLADMHAHMPPPNAPNGLLSDVLALYLANGITTIRSMLGHDGQLNLRDWAKKGEIVSPNLYVAGPGFNAESVHSAQEAIDKVRAQKKEGWDFIKVLPGLTLEEYDAIAKTAKEEKIPFVGHVPESVGLMHAIDMGQQTVDHLDGFIEYLGADKAPVNEKKLAALVKKTKDAGTWIVPTSALWSVLFNGTPLQTLNAYPELKYVPEGAVTTWGKMYESRTKTIPADVQKNVNANRTRILRALHEGGVKLLMGTDAPQQFSVPGFSLHHELRFMRDAGMSPYEILKTGTVNAGQYFASKDSFGTIESGKRADLLLLNANPLANIENIDAIEGVMVNGRWFPRKDLDARLEKIAAKYPRKAAPAPYPAPVAN